MTLACVFMAQFIVTTHFEEKREKESRQRKPISGTALLLQRRLIERGIQDIQRWTRLRLQLIDRAYSLSERD